MKTFFTSDTHFGHSNIIGYCNRPFKTIEEMNERLIKNWNARVSKEDLVIHFGDFCFRNTENSKYRGEGLCLKSINYLEKLNGHITFIKGNHDKNNSLNAIISSCIIELGGDKIFCLHNPKDIDTRFKINLVGHVHEAWKIKEVNHSYIVNVGVDVWGFNPITFDEIMKLISKFKKGEVK
jgi:calcineurin-like phosphoesterase family protein